ncbi:hypothetical protein DFH29DRAFT_1001970 [Suillus ampliporus]|nr:hypothetical protein DFH29DRAFT_1001970 [Suillus ampliporus]
MREKRPYRPPAIHVALLEDFIHAPLSQMHRWAWLRLPCGQIARTAWRESERPLEKLRIAHHVKVIIDEAVRFAEIQYFTQVAIPTNNVGEWRDANIAVISVFSAPDADLVQLSNKTVLLCKYLGDEGLCVVDVTSIKSVVAMIPHRPTLPSGIIKITFSFSSVLDLIFFTSVLNRIKKMKQTNGK